jgi:protein-tyrosine phosphatase
MITFYEVDNETSEVVNDVRRVIPLFAVHNFRDLGGYPTVDGRATRWRTLFRADGLYRSTTQDATRVLDLGVRTVIDLRTEREVTTRGKFPLAGQGVAYHHLPIIDATWGETATLETDDAVEFLVWAYREMLNGAGDKFADAIRLLAHQQTLPAVFHCAAGKDRTGMLAALILGILGVRNETIAADYGLTESAMRRLVEWASVHQPELAELYASMPARFASADPRAMMIILQQLTERHGSVRNYVREIGVDDETIRALERSLLTT